MKRKVFMLILGIEAVLCIALNLMNANLSAGFAAAMAFPFEQTGLLLRMLSLSGFIGNLAAIVIYIVICLIPAAILFAIKKRRRLFIEDGILFLLSIVLLVVLYFMINPGYISTCFGNVMEPGIGKAILGGTVYSLIFSYLILRILRLFFESGTERLQKYMSIMLCLLNVLFVYMLFGSGFGTLLSSIASLKSHNAGNEHLLGMTYVFLALQYLVDALPYVLDVIVVFAALDLLNKLSTNRYSHESVESAGRLSHLCRLALMATVFASAAFNLIQLLFARMLMVINYSVHIPLLSIIFVLAVLLLARYIEENKKLKDYNDMFI